MGMLRLLVITGLLLAVPGADATPGQNLQQAGAVLMDLQGPIGPATRLQFSRAVEQAAELPAQLLVLRLDTPGGLDLAMREVIQDILASPIPVVAYVAPSGARAASAGTYILYASHVAAMAPATNLGAATPIPVFGPAEAPPLPAGGAGGTEPADPKPPAGTAERKVLNDAVAYIRSLAEKRGRNADWAEQAVREGVSLSAEQALAQGVIDLVSADLATLLRQLHGREVETAAGPVRLQTDGIAVLTLEPDWRIRLLSVLTNPAVAYILMLLGIYGLLLEGYNPGAILPGVVGAICLLLALYAFQILPINYAGLGLILLGVILIVAETFVPSLGVLGIGGVAAFVFGSIMLLDSDVPGYGVPLAIVAAVATAAASLMLLVSVMLLRSRRRAVVSGREAMLQETAEALADFSGEGWVRLHGETWRARSAQPVRRGDRLRVARIDGLLLTVEPITNPNGDSP